MHCVVLFGLAVAAGSPAGVPPLQARADSARQPSIDTAIDRGVAHLLELYADGVGRDGPVGVPRLTLQNRPGVRALTVYTLLKSGVERDDPVVERLVASLAFQRFETTYDVACMLLALAAFDPFGQRAWIDELAADLLRWQTEAGDWGYPKGGDLSNTQYAALGLWAAAKAGVDVPPAVWVDLARAVLRYEARDGGFTYVAAGRGPTGSMTSAGVGTLAVCEIQLARSGRLTDELAAQLQRARARGLDWLTKQFSVERNPRHSSWLYYYLYGLERVGAMAGVERIGGHDWYREGAEYIVARQGGNGAWSGTFERVPTLFALLFLRRATGPRVPETPPDGTRLPPVRPAATSGAVRLNARGERPLRLWIDGWSRAEVAALEWPGERGRGPRVLRVEYFADGAPIAAALGDPKRPVERRPFACEHHVLSQGRHELSARIHVRLPPGSAAGAVLASNVIEVEVSDELPGWILDPLEPWRPNLMARAARPKATASSVFTGDPGASAHGFGARFAVDGNRRSPWIADPADDEPTLRIALKRSQRADLVRVFPARLVPRSPDFLTTPLELSVRINRGERRALRVAPGPRGVAELRLEREVVVRVLELRVLTREVEGAAVGIGEIELLRADG